MSQRHADNLSHPGHYLVDPYTRPWSPNGHGHECPTATPFVQCNVNRPSHSEIQLYQNLTMKIHGQGHVCGQRSRSRLTFKIQGYGQGQTHWSHLRPGIQSICLLFVSWQSDHFWLRYRKFHIWPWKLKVKVTAKVKPDGHIWGLGFQLICLLFVSWQSDHFRLRYRKFYIWPWKFKVKVMAKVKSDGHNWALEFKRYVCFSFCGNRTIFGWDIANSVFDLEKSRSRSRQKSNQVIYRSGPTILSKMKEIQKVVQKLSREQASVDGGGGGVWTGTKTSSRPRYTGVT